MTKNTPFEFNPENDGIRIIANETNGYYDKIFFLLKNEQGGMVLLVRMDLFKWEYDIELQTTSGGGVGYTEGLHGHKLSYRSDQIWEFSITRVEQSRYQITATCNNAEDYAINVDLHEHQLASMPEKFYETEYESEGLSNAWDDIVTTLEFTDWDNASDFYLLTGRQVILSLQIDASRAIGTSICNGFEIRI